MQITGIQFNIRKTQKRQVGYVEIIWQLRISKGQVSHRTSCDGCWRTRVKKWPNSKHTIKNQNNKRKKLSQIVASSKGHIVFQKICSLQGQEFLKLNLYSFHLYNFGNICGELSVLLLMFPLRFIMSHTVAREQVWSVSIKNISNKTESRKNKSTIR